MMNRAVNMAMAERIQTFEELVAALKRRRTELGLTQTDVDYMTGLPDGYTGKIEAGLSNPNARNARSLGRLSLQLMLSALDLELVVRPRDDRG